MQRVRRTHLTEFISPRFIFFVHSKSFIYNSTSTIFLSHLTRSFQCQINPFPSGRRPRMSKSCHGHKDSLVDLLHCCAILSCHKGMPLRCCFKPGSDTYTDLYNLDNFTVKRTASEQALVSCSWASHTSGYLSTMLVKVLGNCSLLIIILLSQRRLYFTNLPLIIPLTFKVPLAL
jgi:hypothetical protein